VYVEDVIDVSSFRHCVSRFKNGENDSGDRQRSRRPSSAATTEAKDAVYVPFRRDHRIATSELDWETGCNDHHQSYRKFYVLYL
jgi:hypothetical protein